MSAQLLHLYGPFSIQSYGLFIIIGLLVFMTLVKRDVRFTSLNLQDIFVNIVLVGAALGLLGGRLLYVLTEENSWNIFDFFSFWQGGFSVLGGIIALATVFPLYLHYREIPVVRFLDLIAIYAPILLSISRIGCYFAGCCYGMPTSCAWAKIYTDISCCAPLNIPLHPTQLYSALILFFIFLLLYFVLRKTLKKTGQLTCAFLFLQSIERFTVDFWRADHLPINTLGYVSQNQLIALCITALSLIGFILFSIRPTKKF